MYQVAKTGFIWINHCYQEVLAILEFNFQALILDLQSLSHYKLYIQHFNQFAYYQTAHLAKIFFQRKTLCFFCLSLFSIVIDSQLQHFDSIFQLFVDPDRTIIFLLGVFLFQLFPQFFIRQLLSKTHQLQIMVNPKQNFQHKSQLYYHQNRQIKEYQN